MTQLTADQVAAAMGQPGDEAGVMCPLCPQHDPFADLRSLNMHTIRVHKDVPQGDPSATVAEGVEEPALRAPELDYLGRPTGRGLDPARLAQIDQIGTSESPIDQTPEAILERQVQNGGLFDPVTLKRIVVLGGLVRVRQTVGYDAERGQTERLDYWAPEYGWMRDGFIIERGRVYATPDGPLVL